MKQVESQSQITENKKKQQSQTELTVEDSKQYDYCVRGFKPKTQHVEEMTTNERPLTMRSSIPQQLERASGSGDRGERRLATVQRESRKR